MPSRRKTVWIAANVDETDDSSDIVSQAYATREDAIEGVVDWVMQRAELREWPVPKYARRKIRRILESEEFLQFRHVDEEDADSAFEPDKWAVPGVGEKLTWSLNESGIERNGK